MQYLIEEQKCNPGMCNFKLIDNSQQPHKFILILFTEVIDCSNQTPLHKACARGCDEVAEYLETNCTISKGTIIIFIAIIHQRAYYSVKF